jgi:hypothetical protein
VLPGDGVSDKYGEAHATAHPEQFWCDYCAEGLPVMCGECGLPEGVGGKAMEDDHPFQPVHRIPDPEGIEGVAVVPCAQS